MDSEDSRGDTVGCNLIQHIVMEESRVPVRLIRTIFIRDPSIFISIIRPSFFSLAVPKLQKNVVFLRKTFFLLARDFFFFGRRVLGHFL